MTVSIVFNTPAIPPVTTVPVKDCNIEDTWVWYIDMKDNTFWYRVADIACVLTIP